MRKAVVVEYVEHCGECPYAGYRNFYYGGSRQVCGKLTDDDKVIQDASLYVPTASGKNVRDDCPLEEV